MKESFIEIVSIILVLIIFIVIGSIVFMFCWNYVMPFVFGLPQITYVHALCLMTIARLLFPTSSSSSNK